MKYRIFSLLILSYHTMTFSQESLKFDIGNSSSSVSDFSIEFEKRDYKGTVKFNQLKSTLRDIDFSFGKDYLKNSYASEARTVISNINNASKMYYQTRGEWPTETDQLEQAGQLDISRSTKLKWTFDIQLSDQGGRITATSTEEMSGGAGHQVVYDADNGKFLGYGSPEGE